VSRPDELREAADREAIRQLVYRYCRAVDRRDFALLATLYHADAIDDHTPYFCGPAREFVAQLPAIMAVNRLTSHHITNTLIAVDGAYAEGEIHTLAYHLMQGGSGDEELLVGGRYLDRYIRADGRWLFLHRRIVLDWSARRPSAFDIAAARAGGAVLGQPDDTDPSYGYFRLLPRGG
jgi:hypothetical protein